ncbi:hypothetical protein Zmor_028465 [Zophobas morio]|uniref:Ig-like domain-containing protein n=1 Tax=Zophobas morio TaxID=2755281 RepID=A0AA38HVJ4_9CUCU|nr:hypothetical protein Zmor_028465 [Zophobas morio]
MDYVRQILCLTTVGLSLVYGRQQYFRVQPRDVQVREGGEAMLECEVANLAGQVQWAKEGFALGFSSVIPGLPRHSMVVDRPHGIYNLRVSNASLEDDAEYECQVGPAKPHKAIRAKARLNVMSPPSSVEILNYRHFSKIEIKENEEFHLECRVRNAKPAAKIVWYRGIVELNIPNRDDQIIEVPGNNGDKRFTRYDTHSRISLKATAQDDHAEYTCEAMHEALSSDIPMKTSVQFSVFYPPGLSYIEGYTKVPPSNSSPSLDEENLKNFSDFLITVGTVVGTLIILMNVLLISCFLHRISKKRISEQSNQTRTWATIEMCAPNSHNDTVTGETLSSVNDKSATYSNEGSKNDYVTKLTFQLLINILNDCVSVAARDCLMW